MSNDGYILGVSSHFHDSAAVLIRGQTIVAAAQEERFTRKKADWSFPKHAIDFCLSQLPDPSTEFSLAYYENPALKLDRVLNNARNTAPRGAALWPRTLRMMRTYGQGLPNQLQRICDDPSRIICVPHHRSHAASAFYPSPFETAAVLVVDSVGEWSTTSLWGGDSSGLEPLGEITFPNSLGLFYSAFTQYCGFKVNSGEYKLMGLAPFGQPKFAGKILDHVIDLKADGSFQLNMPFFRFDTDVSTISPLFEHLFGRPSRSADAPIDQHFMDVAASAQAVLEQALISLATTTLEKSGQGNLCLAGGVALNCVANSALIAKVPGLENLWIQPAAGDAGGALGAALEVAVQRDGGARSPGAFDQMRGGFLGPSFNRRAIMTALDNAGLSWDEPKDVPAVTANALSEGLIVGHFDGHMEFGPRSLGNRSILADPRPDDMLTRVNLKIKFRESWRPFAPMVLKDQAETFFDGPSDSPFMLMVATLKAQFQHETSLKDARASGLHQPLELMRAVTSDFSAVTHVDNSARLQTLAPADKSTRAADILQAFFDLTGCPMLLNTSFNVRGEPIICSPQDAVDCFLNTQLDVLVIGPFVVRRADQGAWVNQKIGSKTFVAD
ncbi:MAG: carbamoyltransferase family protein [Pelagimonas sp.]|uniref:carbamoyltransferase family protein n=1 Tax=Pelagimonas sp. TaxID=2073170 RepID=UPI003D6B75FA